MPFEVMRDAYVYNLQDFKGEVSGANWLPVLQELYDTGRPIYAPQGEYRLEGQLVPREWAPRLVGDGKGRTVFRQMGSDPLFSNYADSSGNKYATRESLSTAITASLAAGTRTVLFATAGYAAGDYVLIKSRKTWVPAGEAAVYGEIARILTVDSASQATLQGPLDEEYLTGDTPVIKKLDLLSGAYFADFTFENSDPNSKDAWAEGIDLRYCLAPQVERVEFIGMDQDAVTFGMCVGWRALHVDVYDSTDNAAALRYGYGVTASQGSRGGLMFHCNMDGGRHAFSTEAGVYDGATLTEYGTPPRHTTVSHCNATNMNLHGFHQHEAARYITYKSCRAHNVREQGFVARGVDTRFVDCEASNVGNDGFYIGPDTVRAVIDGGAVRNAASVGIVVEAEADVRNIDVEDTVGIGVEVTATGTGSIFERVRTFRTETGGTASAKRGFSINANNCHLIDCYGEGVDRVVRYASGVTGTRELRLRGKTVTNLRVLAGSNTFTELDARPVAGPDLQVLASASSFTLEPEGPTVTHQPLPIGSDRSVTLSTTGAAAGMRKRVVRTAASTGAFNLNVGTGPLKALATGQWCEVVFDGTAWQLTAFGSL